MTEGSIQLKRSVSVKVVMTAAFREQLIGEARETIKRIEDNLDAVESAAGAHIMALQTRNPQEASEARGQLEGEKARLIRLRNELDWRIREVEGVVDGAELPFRVLEGVTTVAVGDDFLRKMSEAEIVLKDWKVVEIRQG